MNFWAFANKHLNRMHVGYVIGGVKVLMVADGVPNIFGWVGSNWMPKSEDILNLAREHSMLWEGLLYSWTRSYKHFTA